MVDFCRLNRLVVAALVQNAVRLVGHLQSSVLDSGLTGAVCLPSKAPWAGGGSGRGDRVNGVAHL